ncbi:hypothetical protein ABT061_05275 [Streptosporangium sp. NPDC002544]|uniref:hypothetical protein n=1 Tax=Streptosporangium sp. NPDC002544 TaxID=3154538 RepID=UPI003318B594
MNSFLLDYVIHWGLIVILGVIPSIWLGPLALAGVLGLALLVTVISAVVYRIKGHRGWCWTARSGDIDEHIDAIGQILSALPEMFVAWVFHTLWRLLRRLLRR